MSSTPTLAQLNNILKLLPRKEAQKIRKQIDTKLEKEYKRSGWQLKQNEQDKQDVIKLEKLLSNEFNCKSEPELNLAILNRFMYYIYNEYPDLFKQFQTNVPFLHQHFGRGGFICVFSNGSDVKRMKIQSQAEALLLIMSDRIHKAQNIGNGKFLWFPQNELNKLFPPCNYSDKTIRENYNMNTHFLLLIIIYVGLNNENCLIYPTSLAYIETPGRDRILKYLRKTNKLKVKIFANKFPVYYQILHFKGVCDRAFHIRMHMDELRAENIMMHSQKTLPIPDLIDKLKRNISSLLLQFVNDQQKSMVKQQLELILGGEKMKQQLIDHMNGYYAKRHNDDEKTLFTYRSSQMLCDTAKREVVLIMMSKIIEDKNFIDITCKNIVCKNIMSGSLTKCNRDKIMDAIKWELFVNKLIGRTCSNCNKREDRNITNIVFFGVCRCRTSRYCSKVCQKLHWKRKHRFECTSYIFKKMITL
eukprot:551680_1